MLLLSHSPNPDLWDTETNNVIEADHVADNGDRYFLIDDNWVKVSYDGPIPVGICMFERRSEH